MDFDADGNRGRRLKQEFTFTLGGETFELRHGLKVGSTVLDRWGPALEKMRATPEEQETWAEDHGGEQYVRVDDDEFLEIWQDAMLGMLRPGQEVALERVIANDDAPIMLPDLVEVILWAVRTVTGSRPTEASPDSSPGSATPSTEPEDSSSRGASSSPAATVPSSA